MKTAWKLLLGLTVLLAANGCCSWCGQGCNVCRTTAPAWGAYPAATAPAMSMSRPVLPETATLAGNLTPPQVTMR